MDNIVYAKCLTCDFKILEKDLKSQVDKAIANFIEDVKKHNFKKFDKSFINHFAELVKIKRMCCKLILTDHEIYNFITNRCIFSLTFEGLPDREAKDLVDFSINFKM